jgi:hypothetical protein
MGQGVPYLHSAQDTQAAPQWRACKRLRGITTMGVDLYRPGDSGCVVKISLTRKLHINDHVLIHKIRYRCASGKQKGD